MLFRLIDFALAVLKLLIFKFCGIIGISKIEFFHFSGTEKVKRLELQEPHNQDFEITKLSTPKTMLHQLSEFQSIVP